MNAETLRLIDEYASVLDAYMGGTGETALRAAYEIGHRALSAGMGVVDIAVIHHEALARILSRNPDSNQLSPKIYAIEKCFLETLAPFEMTHRGYREANARLEVSEARYRDLFENANDIVFTTDLEGNFTSLNKAGEQLSGYSRAESEGINFREMAGPEFQVMVRHMLDRKLEGEAATTYELTMVNKQGTRVPLEVNTRLMHENGKPVGVHGIARDISERKRAEEALLRLNEGLEEEIKRIAHELHDEAGQLLASVHIALDVAARKLRPAERKKVYEVRGLLDQIEEQLRRLSHELRPTILDDLGLLPALEFLAQGVSTRSGIPVLVAGDAPGGLPSNVNIALYRLVQEALSNAARHSGANRVEVRLDRLHHGVRCMVTDDGSGFDTRSVMGRMGKHGLGLLGMRERLLGVGGTCIINTSPGQGTQIVANVPLESSGASASTAGR